MIGFLIGVVVIVVCINLFKVGDYVILLDDLYGGIYRLFSEIYKEFGLEVIFVDIINIISILEVINENIKVIFIEIFLNLMMKVIDIKVVV